MLSGGFKRSSRFGLIGVFVVAALAAVIGLTMGEGEANPKLAMALIFGVIAIFVVVLLLLQRRRSLKLGAVVFGLIFLTVPPVYLLESFVPLLIGVPLIVIAALYGSFRAIGPGGEVQQGYERMDRAMKPLGLRVTARPQGGFEPRGPTMPGFDYRLRGVTELSGERHGKPVIVRFGGHEDAGLSEVAVAVPCHEFAAKSRRVEVRSGPEGVLVSRRKAEQGDWLCDLWLAERLASS